MFFKRIELVGFKSFATRTVLEFIPGTTVIVGPNGCGKSNILDAIKWVLGEQAASQMRGRKMADVIFAGSASFKALGVAQVTITMDNSRKLLPTEFEEVQVTRRLFRTGESDYLINKTPCRLRDVHDLFLGTGVGKSAYSILEQGRVDQIIQAKPIERRALIEEAAGITKFKTRKTEALRKLERTDVDLARLADLLSEVERQVNSLKRQASKAERYKQALDACRLAEQELLVLRSRELSKQTGELSGRMTELGDRLAALRTMLDGKAAAEEQARDREQALAERIGDEQQALFDMKTNLQTCDHQVTTLAGEMTTHARRVDQIHGEMKELDVRADEIALRTEETRLKIDEAGAAQAAAQARYDAQCEAYSALEESARERTRRIEELTATVEGLRASIVRADNDIRMAEALIDRQQEARDEARGALAELEAGGAARARRREELAAQAATLAAEIEGMQTTLEAERARQARRQEHLAGMLRAIEETARKLAEGRSRLATLAELRANYEGYYQGVREALLAADRGELRGLRGAAPALIHARPEHEVAIEVALATHLQDIVTQTADDAREAIEYLKRSGRGRATFLPLDRLQAMPLAAGLRGVLGRAGVVGLASELVQYDAAIETAVQYLLGTTIVVQDLSVGLDLGREGYRGRYVSLDGQLINPAGSMTGGRIQATGLLTREREIRALEETVTRLESEQGDLRGRIEACQGELASGHEMVGALQSDLEQQRLNHANLTKDVETEARACDEAQRALAERREMLARIDGDVGERRATIERLRPELESKTAELAESEARLTAEREAARGQGGDLMSLSTEVAGARVEIEKARERISAADEQRRVLEHDAESLARQRQARLKEIETLGEEDRRLTEQIERIKSESAASREECERLGRSLSEAQAQREEVALAIRELSQEIEAGRRDERELDNQYREVELRHMELATHLENLSAQAVEKFDRPLAELTAALGEIDKDPHALQVEVAELRDKLDRMGAVNLAALDEYQEQARRLEFLRQQHADLTAAKAQLAETIGKLNETTRRLFQETFDQVREHFIAMFRRLFNGGKADLVLETPEGLDPLLDGGIDIIAQPPGKKLQNISLLSGGEKALTAIALLFGLFLHKPSPFCILDEIDAPLDDINVERFKTIVREFSHQTQFIVITHNKLSMELADALHGVTMEESGVSKLVSVRFAEAEQFIDAV